MKFDPNASNSEERDFPVLPAGEYEYEVENAVLKKSQRTGGLMWEVTLRIDPEGETPSSKVWCYFPEKESMGWKFAQFFKSIGVETDDTDEMKNTIGEIGRCRLEIREADGPYPEKNEVKRFLPKQAEAKPEKPEKKGKAVISDDDLPF